MSRKVFTAGEVLAAADVNSFLMDQTVMSFAGTAARGSAIGTATEGMVSYLEDSNTLSIYDGSVWRNSLSTVGGILQVVTGTTNTSVGTTSTTFVDTGLTATITPKFATSRILVLVAQGLIVANSSGSLVLGSARLLRNATAISGSAGLYNLGTNFVSIGNQENATFYSECILDSPATTSAVTYKTQMAAYSGGTNSVTAQTFNNRANITLLEVSA